MRGFSKKCLGYVNALVQKLENVCLWFYKYIVTSWLTSVQITQSIKEKQMQMILLYLSGDKFWSVSGHLQVHTNYGKVQLGNSNN